MGLNESGELFCAFYDWTQAQPQNTSPWKGETWSWLVGTGKRKLFGTVLKHLLLKVNPRVLRLAFRSFFPHGIQAVKSAGAETFLRISTVVLTAPRLQRNPSLKT